MPQSTMVHEDAYPLPEDTPFPAVLRSVKADETKFQYKAHHKSVKEGKRQVGEEGTISRWRWEFEITDGDYAGLRAWGDTEDRLTNREDNRVRQWAETLQGSVFEMGDGLNTDDLIGLPCIITVKHEEPRPKADGTNFYPCPVQDVFPAGSLDSSYSQEPPF